MAQNLIELLNTQPVPVAVHSLAEVVSVATDNPDIIDTVQLEQLSADLADRISQEKKFVDEKDNKKVPALTRTGLGIAAVYDTFDIWEATGRSEQSTQLVDNALKQFPGTAKPTLEASFALAREENIDIHTAVDIVNETRDKAS